MSDDRLSAYLDNELSGPGRAALEAELENSPLLREELDDLGAVRGLLRGLPAVDLPAGVEISDLSTGVGDLRGRPARRRQRTAFRAAVAVAAAWLLLVGLAPGLEQISPPLHDLVTRHAEASELDPDEASQMGFIAMKPEEVDLGPLPEEIGSMTRTGLYQHQDTVHAMYLGATGEVSVFAQPGRVNWDDLPAGGDMSMMGESQVWTAVMGTDSVLVIEQADTFLVMVADDQMDMVMDMAGDMPPMSATGDSWPRSLINRTRRGVDQVRDLIGL